MGAPKKFADLGIVTGADKYVGDKVKLKNYLGTEITIHKYKIVPSKYPEKGSPVCLHLQISVNDVKYVAFSIAKYLIETIQQITVDAFPIITTIVNDNEFYEFT